MQQSFYTIKESITSELVEKKSRFIANVFYVEDENDANRKIEEIKKENRDSKHNVFAYRLNSGEERYSDDGEPSGTAGMPILELLRGEGLVNVLVVVTRYFGGILLGTGGLVRAYGGVTKIAVSQATKIEMILCAEYKITIDYDYYSILQYYCSQHEIKILNTIFLDKIEVNVLVNDSYTSKFLHDLSEFTNRKATYDKVKTYYHE